MTRLQTPPEGISQETLAGLVTEAVQQALMQQGVLMDAQALASASALAGSVAAALLPAAGTAPCGPIPSRAIGPRSCPSSSARCRRESQAEAPRCPIRLPSACRRRWGGFKNRGTGGRSSIDAA
ncbi:hypothetical protein ACVOMV_10055 [Mesorhizobium atlanticum]